MGQRRHHYEHAFEQYLRDARVPYLSVNEAKKSLLPERAVLRTQAGTSPPKKLKNFDFVVYGQGSNLLVEVKGRRLSAVRLKDGTPSKPRMESWVTMDDLEALSRWRMLFGPAFEPVFVFVYWCDDVPPDGVFVETIEHRSRWYTLRAIGLDAYMEAMKVRSPKWGTMHLASADFDALSHPFGAFDSVPAYQHAACGIFGRDPLGESEAITREPVLDRLVEVHTGINEQMGQG